MLNVCACVRTHTQSSTAQHIMARSRFFFFYVYLIYLRSPSLLLWHMVELYTHSFWTTQNAIECRVSNPGMKHFTMFTFFALNHAICTHNERVPFLFFASPFSVFHCYAATFIPFSSLFPSSLWLLLRLFYLAALHTLFGLILLWAHTHYS